AVAHAGHVQVDAADRAAAAGVLQGPLRLQREVVGNVGGGIGGSVFLDAGARELFEPRARAARAPRRRLPPAPFVVLVGEALEQLGRELQDPAFQREVQGAVARRARREHARLQQRAHALAALRVPDDEARRQERGRERQVRARPAARVAARTGRVRRGRGGGVRRQDDREDGEQAGPDSHTHNLRGEAPDGLRNTRIPRRRAGTPRARDVPWPGEPPPPRKRTGREAARLRRSIPPSGRLHCLPRSVRTASCRFRGTCMKTGVLLLNLGSPEAPVAAAVRPYLREFLGDPRVIDIPAPLRWLLLNAVILPFRPAKSAEAYAKVWMEEGSPLLVHSRAFAAKLAAHLGDDHVVSLGMRYGNPSVAAALEPLLAAPLK